MEGLSDVHDDKDDHAEDNTREREGGSETEVVLDLSGRRLKRLERAPLNQTFATALVLDNNYLQNLANLDSYGELERLSIANNQIVRMYWFARMYSLRILNLPNNNIVQIEGLRELHHLIHLNLSGNNLKTIEGLCHSHKLEHLNLSGNFLSQIVDFSMLKNLKELFLHRNRITSLHRCNKYLPTSLFILTLSDNCISDLNELCNLSHLTNLEQFTFLNNPALEPLQQVDEDGLVIGPPLAFDNRPYVINWCLNLKVLDGYKVTPKESLKAEWLYSQGKGRGFQVGEHAALVQYLSGVCLAGGGWGGADLPDDDDKLGKILQLAKQHQQELRYSSVNGHDNSDSSSGRGSRGSSHHDSPGSLRRNVSRTTSLRRHTAPQRPVAKGNEKHYRSKSHSSNASSHLDLGSGHHHHHQQHPDVNSHSYHVELSSTLYGGDLRTPDTPGLMTQSMDPSLLAQLSAAEPHSNVSMHQMSQSLGPEQMARSLKAEQMLSSHSGSVLARDPTPSMPDMMSQSLGPEQLQQSLMSRDPLDARSQDHPVRPTRLFSEEDSDKMEEEEEEEHAGIPEGAEGSRLEGSSEFVPAPDSIVSPEFQCPVGSHLDHQTGSNSREGASSHKSPYVGKSSGKLLHSSKPATAPTAAQASPRISSRSGSSKSRSGPARSPAAPDSNRGSPRNQQLQQQQRAQAISTPPPSTCVGNMSPRLRQSPKPAPRSSRMTGTATQQASTNSSGSKRNAKSPSSSKTMSEGDSDNTDSEMSVSKLQTIKSIAAERRGKERKSTSAHSRLPEDHSYGPAEKSAVSSSHHHHHRSSSKSATHSYNPERYAEYSHLRGSSRGRNISNSSGGSLDSLGSSRGQSVPRESSMTKLQAALTIQRYWRGYSTRCKNAFVRQMREDIRHSRAEDHIRLLTEKLRIAEAALERERRLRHLQLDAIRTLWREIQKLQAGRKDGVNTPSTPMTPLTPLTPLESGKKLATGGACKNKLYSEQSVKELTDFCSSLQSQVSQLQDSLSMVTQVMNAFCNLPGSQSLLTMSQSSGSGMEKSAGEEEVGVQGHVSSNQVPLKQSVASFTNSIVALTSSIKTEDPPKTDPPASSIEAKTKEGSPPEAPPAYSTQEGKNVSKHENGPSLPPPDLGASVTSLTSNDLNSTGQDVSTLSNDSNDPADASHQQDADLSDSSQSSLSASLSGGLPNNGGTQHRPSGPPRPSTLPVSRTHTPRSTS